jgi:FAD/FMN-containing dehydrogenase
MTMSDLAPAEENQPASVAPFRWTNWVGNQSFVPEGMASPQTEASVVDAVRAAAKGSHDIRAPGSGHSFTPIVETSGTLLNLDALQGVISVDADRRDVTAWSQTRISAFGDALWDHGLALSNQGDIDSQAIAGAIATGTHGSGRLLGSFSSTLKAIRIVDGLGDVHDLSTESNPDIFPAFQVSIGMLGIMTQVTLQVAPAYYIHEQIRIMHISEVLDRWDALIANNRHFSFFWMPSDESAALYGFKNTGRDYCMVKLYNEVPSDFTTTSNDRIDRSYRIYPHVFDPNFHELEYFMPVEHAKEALSAQRELMLRSLPDSRFPLEVRFIAPDKGWLSPNYNRANIVLSVSGAPGTDYWPYLTATDALFSQFEARPHWGKLHFMTPERMEKLFPRYDDFRRLRRRFDPKGIFLNPHLHTLFK